VAVLDSGDRAALMERLSALERRVTDVEWKATSAWEAENKREEAERQRIHDSLVRWNFAMKATAIASVIIALGLLLFGKR
jgi:hypothetical protein